MKYSNKLIFENGILAYKKCTKCGEVKPVDRFSKNKTTSTGYASQCKDCFNKRKRDLNNPNISFDALKKEYPKLGESKKQYKIPDQNIIRAGVTCKDNCIKYPCYRGIDNCKLNLAAVLTSVCISTMLALAAMPDAIDFNRSFFSLDVIIL